MRKNNDIRVEMVRIKGDIAPFIQVDYMDKDAQEHTGLMLLDSGSSVNVLSNDMANSIGNLCKMNKNTTIASITQEKVNAELAKFSFAFGGKQFHETFCINCQHITTPINGLETIGILGNEFLQQQHLVIDYNDHTLHSSKISPNNLHISDCSFFFPMEIGLKFFGLPVLSIKQNGKELVTLVDTGATSNMIANQALTDNEFKCKRLREKDIITGIKGKEDVDQALIHFNMLSLDGDGVSEILHYDLFSILPHNILELDECDTNGDPLPPIEVLVGSPFMAKEGWILDFGAKIIYRRKPLEVLKEAV